MNVKTLFATASYSTFADAALLAFRAVVGVAFMFHGWGKIQNPFGWMGPDSGMPGILQALAALSEFGGGAALVLGLLTPLASLGIACTMVVAVYIHAIERGDPFVAKGGGGSYELGLVYLVTAVLLIALTPGSYSLDRYIFGRRR